MLSRRNTPPHLERLLPFAARRSVLNATVARTLSPPTMLRSTSKQCQTIFAARCRISFGTQPLVGLENRKVGYTSKALYSGSTVGEPWSRSGENSAFYGSFSL